MPDRAVVEHTPIPVTLTREQADALLEDVVERLWEEMNEVQAWVEHDHLSAFDTKDPRKMAALRNVVKLAKLAGDLL